MSKYFFIALFLFVFAITPRVNAGACIGLPSIGSQAFSNCTLTVSGITGADQANNNEASIANTAVLTLDNGASVTINAGGSLAVGSVVLEGGTIAIADGGIISPGAPLYIPDADGDGWASTALDAATVTTATASGKRRLSLMRGTTADCGDAQYATSNACCAAVGTACGSDGACCGNICGADVDGDNYFSLAAGHTGTCQASAKPYTDCYDANPATTNAELAYPGSATCGATHRGDWNYDYNCSSTSTTCGTTWYGVAWYNYGGKDNRTGLCTASGFVCETQLATPANCGATGYTQDGPTLQCSSGCAISNYKSRGTSSGIQACQ